MAHQDNVYNEDFGLMADEVGVTELWAYSERYDVARRKRKP